MVCAAPRIEVAWYHNRFTQICAFFKVLSSDLLRCHPREALRQNLDASFFDRFDVMMLDCFVRCSPNSLVQTGVIDGRVGAGGLSYKGRLAKLWLASKAVELVDLPNFACCETCAGEMKPLLASIAL